MKGRYKRPLTSQNFICNEKEKRYKRNIMFLFAGHSDRLLSNNLEKQCFPRLLESYLHSSQRKSYLFIPFFFFITCKILTCERTLISALHTLRKHHKICCSTVSETPVIMSQPFVPGLPLRSEFRQALLFRFRGCPRSCCVQLHALRLSLHPAEFYL